MTVAADQLRGLPFASRFCRDRVQLPDPRVDVEAFADALTGHLATQEYSVVLPLCDNTNITIVHQQERLSQHAAVPVPSIEALEWANDKLRTLETARAMGIETPVTYCHGSSEDLLRLAADAEFPCIRKLRSSAGSIGQSLVSSRDELAALPVPPSVPSERIVDPRTIAPAGVSPG